MNERGLSALAAALGKAALAAALLGGAVPALAHDVSEQAQQRMLEGGLLDILYIGAEHMLTGYDHLLFLLGVMFFATRFGQIVGFVTAFTVGHTLTLLFATLLGITANAYLIDAVIALTVCYKAAENLGLFQKFIKQPPHLLFMVFIFGLIHGFGLSTRLQQMTIAGDPDLVGKIIAFNVGVEMGQVVALAAMVGVVRLWRQTEVWAPVSRAANAALMGAGFVLFVQQVHAYSADKAAPALAVPATIPVTAAL